MDSISCPAFNFSNDDQNLYQRWNKWLNMFENYLVAIGIANDVRRKALLLHLAGDKIRETYRSQEDPNDTFDHVKEKLNISQSMSFAAQSRDRERSSVITFRDLGHLQKHANSQMSTKRSSAK